MAVHMGPEPQAQGSPAGWGGGRELFTLQQGGITWTARVSGVNVSEGSSHSVGGKAGVISLWSSVGIVAASSHFPIKVSCRVIRELAQTRVECTVTFALISRLELNAVHSNVSSVPPGLVTLRLGNGFEYQRV